MITTTGEHTHCPSPTHPPRLQEHIGGGVQIQKEEEKEKRAFLEKQQQHTDSCLDLWENL